MPNSIQLFNFDKTQGNTFPKYFTASFLHAAVSTVNV